MSVSTTAESVRTVNAIRILEAAAELFVEDGITASGMRRIAARAGVSVPTVYHHFANKRELVQAVLEREGIGPGVLAAPPRFCGSVATRLEAYTRWQLGILEGNLGFARLVHRESSAGDPDAAAVFAGLVVEWKRTIRDALEGADDLRPGVDLDVAAEAIKCCLWGIFSVVLSPGSSFDPEPSINALVATIPAGLSKSKLRRGRG